MKRVCQVIRVKKESLDEYRRIHDPIPEPVKEAIQQANIVDYSIHLFEEAEGGPLLVANFKYTGQDFDKDMAIMAANKEVQTWWETTDAMQSSLVPGATGSKDGIWWKDLKEVFRQE